MRERLIMPTNNPGHRNVVVHRRLKPALLNGRVQKMARRALAALGTASASEIMDWTYARLPLHGRRRTCDHSRATTRALRQIGARRLHRGPGRGRPYVWTCQEPPVRFPAARRGAALDRNKDVRSAVGLLRQAKERAIPR